MSRGAEKQVLQEIVVEFMAYRLPCPGNEIRGCETKEAERRKVSAPGGRSEVSRVLRVHGCTDPSNDRVDLFFK